jgi:GNAT superfamily N-acetyltransferase
MSISVREATLEDAPAAAALITYLGYETTADDMRTRLQSLSVSPDYVSLVATEEENVVGFLGLAFSLYYERTGIYARIAALSVAPTAQGKGVGGALVRAAEEIAKSRNALFCVVNSGVHRVEAHKFYEHLGFVAKGKAFSKPLAEI